MSRVNSKSKKLEIASDLVSLYQVYGYLLYGQECKVILPDNLKKLYQKVINNQHDKFIQQINYMYSYHQATSENVLKIYNDSKFHKYNQDKITIIRKDNALDILYDFFNWCGPNYYKLVKEIINNNQVGICKLFDDNQGLCYYVGNLKKSYILCDIDVFDIYSISVLVHELGHAIAYDILRNNSFKHFYNQSSCNYIEVPSMFFELLFLEYLLKNNIVNYDTLFTLHNLYSAMLSNFIDIRFCTHQELGNQEIKKHAHIDEEATQKIAKSIINELNLTGNVVHKLRLKFNLTQSIIYGYGIIIARHFVEQYKQDPKEALKALNNFICSMYLEDAYDILNTCGLNADEICNCKLLKKELKTHMHDIKTKLKMNY